MNDLLKKPKENRNKIIPNSDGTRLTKSEQGYGFTNNRPELVAQNKLQSSLESSPIKKKEKNLQHIINTGMVNEESTGGPKSLLQRQPIPTVQMFQTVKKINDDTWRVFYKNSETQPQNDEEFTYEEEDQNSQGTTYLKKRVAPNLTDWDKFRLIDQENHDLTGDKAIHTEHKGAFAKFMNSFEGQWDGFNEAVHKQLKTTAKEDASVFSRFVEIIKKQYKPSKYLYVGVGASAEPVIEYMKGMDDPPKTARIAISGVKLAAYEEANEIEQARARSYITKNLGKWAAARKDILLLDATEGGDTLMVIKRLIDDADDEIDNDREVISASLSQTKTFGKDKREEIDDTGIQILQVLDRDIRVFMRQRFYQQYYKQHVGRIYDKIKFSDVLSGAVISPVGYNAIEHKLLHEFARELRHYAEAAALVEKHGEDLDFHLPESNPLASYYDELIFDAI